MSDPDDRPRGVRLTLLPGQHLWCACRRSRTRPLCDDRGCGGIIAGEDGGPLEVVVDEPTEMRMCTCGHTRYPPRCDGSHNRC